MWHAEQSKVPINFLFSRTKPTKSSFDLYLSSFEIVWAAKMKKEYAHLWLSTTFLCWWLLFSILHDRKEFFDQWTRTWVITEIFSNCRNFGSFTITIEGFFCHCTLFLKTFHFYRCWHLFEELLAWRLWRSFFAWRSKWCEKSRTFVVCNTKPASCPMLSNNVLTLSTTTISE